MAETPGHGQPQPGTSTSGGRGIPVLQPPYPQMLLGPVIYVPGVIRPGPGNRPVFVPGPGPGIPAFLQGQQAMVPSPPGSPPGSSSATPSPAPQLLLLRPHSQAQSMSDIDAQSRAGRETKAQGKEPEKRPAVEPEPVPENQHKEPEAGEKETAADAPQKGWRPRWLRRHVLLAFAIWFILLLGVIEALVHLSTRDEGISPNPASNLFYAWTISPPAVVVITAVLWDRVHYQAMRLMPWIQLNKEPSDARRSIALDYHARTFYPTVFVAALRNRHYLVACSALTALFLRVLIVLSTGMLFLEGPTLSEGGPAGRLLVQPILLHVMAGLLGVQALLAIVSAITLQNPELPPANPETVMGISLNLMHSTKLLQKLSGSGPLTLPQTMTLASGTYRTIQRPSIHNASTDSLIPPTFTVSYAPKTQGQEYQLSPAPDPEPEPESGTTTSAHSPFLLGIQPRILTSILLLAMIGALVGVFQISRGTPPGIINVNSSMTTTYLHYLWTSLPTLLAVGVSLFFTAVDGQIRSHAGFLFLQGGRATVQQLSTNFGDRLGVGALVAGMGLEAWPIVVSSLAGILGILLTIVSGTLFTIQAERLVVNETPAYVVIGLLGALFVLNLALLGLLPRKLAPKSPGSILGMASLLADSNIFERFPLAVEYMVREDIYELFGGVVFRIGWFEKPEGGGMAFAIGVVDGTD